MAKFINSLKTTRTNLKRCAKIATSAYKNLKNETREKKFGNAHIASSLEIIALGIIYVPIIGVTTALGVIGGTVCITFGVIDGVYSGIYDITNLIINNPSSEENDVDLKQKIPSDISSSHNTMQETMKGVKPELDKLSSYTTDYIKSYEGKERIKVPEKSAMHEECELHTSLSL